MEPDDQTAKPDAPAGQPATAPPEPEAPAPEPVTEPDAEEVPHRQVDAEILLAGEGRSRSGEVVVGEFAGSIDGVAAVVDGEDVAFDDVRVEEVEVGVARVRVTSSSLPAGPTAVRLSVVA